EIDALTRGDRRLVIVDSVACPQNRCPPLADRPRKPQPRCEVVSITLVAAGRDSICAYANNRSRCRIINGCTVLSVDRWRVVLIPQACGDSDPGPHSKGIVDKEVVAL